MSKEKATSNSRRRKQEKGSAPNADTRLAAGGELHQIAGGAHPALTTNQGLALSDNQKCCSTQSPSFSPAKARRYCRQKAPRSISCATRLVT